MVNIFVLIFEYFFFGGGVVIKFNQVHNVEAINDLRQLLIAS